MCVIMAFAPGARMNKAMFFNAVYNNWHGYGLILKDAEDHLQLIKKYDENGTDPEEVYDLLEKNIDITRYLHVRHSTKGSTDIDMVQPFSAYHSTSREVYFMHNGTLSGYGDTGGKGKSDTLDFVEKVIAPSLLSWSGPEGKADYTDPLYQKLIVEKQWSYGNMGLFVSNDLEMYRLGGGWKEFPHPADPMSQGEIWVSNTTYFDKVQRGPRFQQLEDERKAREAAAKAAEAQQKATTSPAPAGNSSSQSSSSGTEIVPWNDTQWDEDDFLYGHGHGGAGFGSGGAPSFMQAPVKKFNDNACMKDPTVIRALNIVTNKFDLDDPKNLVNLSAIDYMEWHEWLEEDQENGLFTAAALLEHMVKMYRKLALREASSRIKHQKAEKRLQEISLEKKTGIESGAKNVAEG